MLFPKYSTIVRAAAAFCLLAALTLTGCGYKVTNSQTSIFGDGSSTMFIRNVNNSTVYPWITQSLRTVMYDELTDRNIVKMTDSEDADYKMDIDISKFSTRSRVLGVKDEVLEYTVNLTFVANVYDGKTNELKWTSNSVSISRAYPTNDERLAGEEITRLLVEKIADQLRSSF